VLFEQRCDDAAQVAAGGLLGLGGRRPAIAEIMARCAGRDL